MRKLLRRLFAICVCLICGFGNTGCSNSGGDGTGAGKEIEKEKSKESFVAESDSGTLSDEVRVLSIGFKHGEPLNVTPRENAGVKADVKDKTIYFTLTGDLPENETMLAFLVDGVEKDQRARINIKLAATSDIKLNKLAEKLLTERITVAENMSALWREVKDRDTFNKIEQQVVQMQKIRNKVIADFTKLPADVKDPAMKTMGPRLDIAEQRLMIARKSASSIGRPGAKTLPKDKETTPLEPGGVSHLDKNAPKPALVLPKPGPGPAQMEPKVSNDGSRSIPLEPSVVPLQPSIGPQGLSAVPQLPKVDKDR